ncbi:MAG TPA: DinB family protein [Candidatus Acidoferrales bacterium]|nr:DinB family protein [Candidatus Acidoferrales bacterium]
MKMTRQLHLFLVAVLFIVPAAAQDSAKGASPDPAASPSAALLKQWNEIGRKLTAMAEDFPENKYDFKAAPTTGTFAERLIHGASANYFFTNSALGQKLPPDEDPPRAQFKNKAAIVAYVKKSFADGAAAIKSKGDKGISALVIDPFAADVPANANKEKIRLSDLGHGIVEHSGEIYGQLTVYYRVAGMIPPESRPKK